MLKSIDLFSGVGGITLALRGIAKPVLYCDVDPVARASMEFNMKRGLLPRARIHTDVTKLTAPPKADMVVGGCPCVGHSSIGSKAGFEEPQSALFYDMLRVLDASGATAIFIENVPGIMRKADIVIGELSVKRGFQLRWTVVRASDMGAPHVRARWFCLGVKSGSPIEKMTVQSLRGYTPHSWDSTAPARTCGRVRVDGAMQSRLDARVGLMGNSVVPDAVRLAFLRLFSGGACVDLKRATKLTYAPLKTALVAAPTDICVVSAGRGSISGYVPQAQAAPPLQPQCDLLFDPKLVKRPLVRSVAQTTEVLEAPVKAKAWATPRHGMTRPCRVLTGRSAKDLPTQIKFERRTVYRLAPMTAAFNEWLMGYPAGFTDVAGDGV